MDLHLRTVATSNASTQRSHISVQGRQNTPPPCLIQVKILSSVSCNNERVRCVALTARWQSWGPPSSPLYKRTVALLFGEWDSVILSNYLITINADCTQVVDLYHHVQFLTGNGHG